MVLTPKVYSYGSMLIAGALERAGFDVHLMKFTSKTRIDLLPQADVYAVGLYSTLHVLEYRDWVSMLKASRNKPIAVGGPVAQIPELVLTNMNDVDAVVVGEGEAYTSQGDVVKTKPRGLLTWRKCPCPRYRTT